jgi:hypothetical protein
MAEVIVYETLQPTDEVLARHRRVFEESGIRVLEEPQIELVPNPAYVQGIGRPERVLPANLPGRGPSLRGSSRR